VASQKLAKRIGMQPRGRTDRFYNATCELFEAHQTVAGSDSERDV